MNPLTDLEARLATPSADALRKDILNRMATLEQRLRKLMSHQPQTQAEFARLTVLASASETAQKVIADTR